MTKKYQIYSKEGVGYGIFEGDTPKDAFLEMVLDGGGEYGSPEVGTEDDWTIVEWE